LLHFRVPDASSRVGFIFNRETIFDWKLIEKFRVSHTVLEAFPVETHREQAGLELVVFVIVFAESKAGDLELMTHYLSVELPLTGCVLITIEMVLLEEGNTVVSVGGSKVVATVGDHNLNHSVGALLVRIRDHQVTSRQLFEMCGR